MKNLFLAAALFAATQAAAQAVAEPPVRIRLTHLTLPTDARQRIQAKADQGITALTRYLELTRTVYQLRLMDIVVGLDMSSVSLGDVEATDREIERAIREGKAIPVR